MNSLPPITSQFKTFIQGLLKLGGLKSDHIESFTDEKSMNAFRQAFIHKSYSSEFNYELFEYLGDLSLNLSIVNYIRDYYRDIINIDWLSHMKLYFISKKLLGLIAERHGFFEHILYSKDVEKRLKKEKNMKESELYKDMMEDTVEAFLGALEKVSEEKKKYFGTYVDIARNIIYSYMDQIEIDPDDYYLYYDETSRLKEIFDKYHWEFKEAIIYNKDTAIVRAYPRGDQQPIPENKVEYRFTDLNKDKAKKTVISIALKDLKEEYKIQREIPNPKKKNAWKPKKSRPEFAEITVSETRKLPQVTPEIKATVSQFLLDAGLKRSLLNSFTDKRSMKIFVHAFTHKSYTLLSKYDLFEFVGDMTLNLCVGNYIHDRYPEIINVDWLTRMKHYIISKKLVGLAANFKGIVYSDEMGLLLKQDESVHKIMVEDTLEAFLGALREVVIRKKKTFGTYIELSRNLIFHLLDQVELDPHNYRLYYDSISRLKEVYDKYHWDFKQSLTFTQALETGIHTATIEAFPKGNQRRYPNNRVEYTFTAQSKDEAKRGVTALALRKLEENYNIKSKIPDYRKRNAWKPSRK